MRLDSSASPCRPHPCSVEHADLVYTYRGMAEDWQRAAESATGGYATEMLEYRSRHPPPTLRDFLIKRGSQR